MEPFRSTLTRTVTIALIGGALLVRWRGGGLAGWAVATLLVFWISFGGHWVEVFFLNYVRPRLPRVRILVWFIGGICLVVGMRITAMAIAPRKFERWPPWWVGGLAFIGIELAVHLVLQLAGRPSFYNGRG
jgi:hypothetical protein